VGNPLTIYKLYTEFSRKPCS